LNEMDATDFPAWHLLNNFPVGMGSAVTIARTLLEGPDAIRFDLNLSRSTAEDVLFGFEILRRGIRPWYLDRPLCIARRIGGAISRGTAATLYLDEKAVNDYIAQRAVDAITNRILSVKPEYADALALQRARLDLQFTLKREHRDPRKGFGIPRCLRERRGFRSLIRLHVTNALMLLGLLNVWHLYQFLIDSNDKEAKARVLARLKATAMDGLRQT